MVTAAGPALQIAPLDLPTRMQVHGAAHKAGLSCLACGGDEIVPLAPQTRDRSEYAVVGCPRCGLAHLNPLPTKTAEYYRTAYREETNLDICGVRTSDLEDSERRWRELASRLNPSTAVLDVGAGSGAFLHHAQGKTAAQLYGVEPHDRFRRSLRAEGFEIRADLQEFPRTSFDVVLLFHVFEHVESPREFLREIRRHLRLDGTLVIEVPSLTDALLWVYPIPAFWSFYWQFPHIWYFSPGPLRQIVETEGFRVQRLQGVQRYGLRNHLQWLSHGGPGKGDQFKTLISDAIDAQYRDALIEHEVYDTIWMECSPI